MLAQVKLPPGINVFLPKGEPFERHVSFKTDAAKGIGNPWAAYTLRLGTETERDAQGKLHARFLLLLSVDATTVGMGSDQEVFAILRFQEMNPVDADPELVDWERVLTATPG